jgi:hypothetical protein
VGGTRRLFFQGMFGACLAGGARCDVARADSYPIVTGLRKEAHPICGIDRWSMSGDVTFISATPPDDLIRALQAVSKTMEIQPAAGFIGDISKPILQVDKIDGKRDGIVCINSAMLEKIQSTKIYSYEILVGLISHEFGHILQLRNNCFVDFSTHEISNRSCFGDLVLKGGKKQYLELHADFMSGWAMARLYLLTVDTFAGYTKQIFTQGEYLYDSNDHHGTPRERLNAMADGFWFGKTGSVLGYDANQYLEDAKIKANESSSTSAFAVGQAVLAGRKY